MKTKVVLLSFASALFALTAFGQTIENDDMYFNSKDRAKLRAQKPTEVSYASAKTVKKTESKVEEDFNPTDSYSARNVNPEFTARSNSEMATADNQDYFVNNYKYQTASNLNNWNNNFSNTYNNPWYGANYYGSSMNSWNSPYYGSSYGMYGNPWCNPYQSGWSGSFSYYTGNAWNYGWNSGWGMNYGYGNPYASYWGPNYGYGNYYGGYGYPSTVVIVNNNYEGNGRQYTYGKRGTAGRTSVSNTSDTNDSRSRATTVGASSGTITSGGRIATQSNSGGRVVTTAPNTRTTNTGRTTRQDDYYNRSWRSTTSQSTSTTTPSRSTSNDNWNWNSNSGSSSRTRSSSFDSGSGSSSFSTPSRSSSGDSGRSSSGSGGSSSSGGSNGRTRGN